VTVLAVKSKQTGGTCGTSILAVINVNQYKYK